MREKLFGLAFVGALAAFWVFGAPRIVAEPGERSARESPPLQAEAPAPLPALDLATATMADFRAATIEQPQDAAAHVAARAALARCQTGGRRG